MTQKFREEIQKKPTWNRQELLDLVDLYKKQRLKIVPDEAKVGDIFSYKTGPTNHPCIVLSVGDDRVTAVAVSSTPCLELFLTSTESRVFGNNSFVTNNVFTCPKSAVTDAWIAEYGNHRHVRQIKKMLKEYYNDLLRINKKPV